MKRVIFILLCVFHIIGFLVSCKKEPEIDPPDIKGSISIQDGLSFSDFWLKTSDGSIYNIDAEGHFELNNLACDRTYDLYFSNSTPSSAVLRSVSSMSVYGALIRNITILKNGTVDLGIVPMMPTCTIEGKVTLQNKGENENAEIDVYIPGTSFYTKTESSGSFSLKNIPEGTYSMCFTRQGFLSKTIENVIVTCNAEGDATCKKIGDFVLAKDEGNVFGLVSLEGLTDYSNVKVSIRGTTAETVSNSKGEYSLSVPSGSYTGGIVYECEGYETFVNTSSLVVEQGSLISLASVEMQAIAALEVSGTIKIKGASDSSGINVTFKKGADSFVATTSADGKWKISYLPLGEYSVSITEDNITELNFMYSVKAGKIDLGEYNLVANGASVVGYVKLPGKTDCSGAKVRITNENTSEYSECITKVDGYYKFTNLDTTASYTLKFEKDGWNSATASVSNLSTFERREIPSQSLSDDIAPIINSIKINNGENTTTEREVTINIDAIDYGTGLDQLVLSYDNTFTNCFYKGSFKSSVVAKLSSGNNEKTVYAKVTDFAGNEVSSDASIKLATEKTKVQGILADDELHWTEESSPYLVTGNISVPSGKTLIIDPGVDVQFDNGYSIQVEGKIKALGTESKKINFYGVGNGIDNWVGIIGVVNDVSEDGNWLDYVIIRGAKTACKGYLRVTNSEIDGKNTFGNADQEWDETIYTQFMGYVEKCTINGNMNVRSATFVNNDINCLYISGSGYDVTASTFTANRITKVGSPKNSSSKWGFCMARSIIKNNLIKGLKMLRSSMDYGPKAYEYNTMIDASFCGSSRVCEVSSFKNNSFENCSISSYSDDSYFYEFSNCNFDDKTTVSTLRQDPNSVIKYTNCFWGEKHTEELQVASATDNISFIRDYYDSFSLAKIDWSDWKSAPIDICGYQGPDFSF